MSQRQRIERVKTMLDLGSDGIAFRLIYEWVKTNVITYSEFLELLNIATFGSPTV